MRLFLCFVIFILSPQKMLSQDENNSTYYFKYFRMPANGTAGFEEHWWYKDYGNTRIVGLDSNSPFTNQEQAHCPTREQLHRAVPQAHHYALKSA